MDAVFKLLHVEVARKATEGELKIKKKRRREKNLVLVLQCVKLKETRIK